MSVMTVSYGIHRIPEMSFRRIKRVLSRSLVVIDRSAYSLSLTLPNQTNALGLSIVAELLKVLPVIFLHPKDVDLVRERRALDILDQIRRNR